jgi:hypothetical protein
MAAQEGDETAAEVAAFKESEAQEAEESDPNRLTDPWDVYRNAMQDCWYY